jgi:mono/diheme cytochrome c family protein
MLFRTYCASCHGEAGKGNGPMAEHMRKAPADLTRYAQRNGGIFPSNRLRRVIDGRDVPSHGERDMPVWGDVFRTARDRGTAESVEARIEALVKYVEAMQERAAQ